VVLDTHGPNRQRIIASTLARFDDAIVVLGDSIVEASTLPRALCGHAIINAGIAGASTASKLGSMLGQALAGRPAALIVVSLGTNDALVSHSVTQYRSNYLGLLTELEALTARRVVAAIPPPESGKALEVSAAVIEGYNAVLPGLAEEARAAFIPLPTMPKPHTLDGIHLNGAAYEVWDQAILTGIKTALCK
jgi:lysophospholipase L1-like esterase